MADEEIREDEQEVAEEATPETNKEATEQRADDYDGLARRIDEVARLVRDVLDAVERVESGMGAFVEAGAVISEPDVVSDGLAEAVADAIEEAISIDELDLEI